MQHFIPFLSEHWLLSVSFLGVLLLILLEERRTQGQKGVKISTQRAIHLLNKEQAVIVDLRSKTTFEAGHIADALSCPLAEFSACLQKLERYKKQPLILVCANGLESRKAGEILHKEGYASVQLLEGGMNAWRDAHLPITTQSQKKKNKRLTVL